MQTHITDNAITLTIPRTPMTVEVGGQTHEVIKLGIPLSFSRKPGTLDDVGGCGGRAETVLITETKMLETAEFDRLAHGMLRSLDWLDGKGGGCPEGTLCVEVLAPNRPILYLNPEGGDYARYAARLG